MTEAQKKKIIYEYNLHISKVKEADTNTAVWNRCIGFGLGYDSLLNVLGYFQVFDIEGKCIEIKSYNKEKENE